MFAVAKKFATHVIPGIVKPLRVLWNEVIGFVFVVLGVVFGFSAFRRFRDFDGELSSFLALAGTAIFVLILILYGVSSFWRARKISRS
jgi:hypothetical protein